METTGIEAPFWFGCDSSGGPRWKPATAADHRPPRWSHRFEGKRTPHGSRRRSVSSARASARNAARSAGSSDRVSTRSPVERMREGELALRGGTAARARARGRRRPGRRRPAGRPRPGGRGSGASGPSRARRAARRLGLEPLDLEMRHGLPRRVACRARRASGRRGRADRRLDPARSATAAGPRTSARYVRSNARSRTSSVSADAPPRSGRARSGRTCRGRGGARPRARSGSPPATLPASASTSVPLACPAPGCTTSPAGLSTTSTCSSSHTIRGSAGGGAPTGAARRGELDLLPARAAGSSSRARRRPRARPPRPLARRRRASRVARRGNGRAARPPPPAAPTFTRRSRRRASGAAAPASRSAATSAASRIATPMTMKLSARLNAGHQPRSMKSVTWRSRIRSTRFERLPPTSNPSAAGRTGWRAPDRAKNTTIQTTAAAVTNVTIAVAPAKKPKAMPEFWTWWIESGPTTCTDSSRPEGARDDVLRHLVGDHRCQRDGREARPLPHAGRERPLGDGERRQPVGRRADPHVSGCCGSFNRAPLIVDAEPRPGNRA